MDVRIKAFQAATDTFIYLARLDVAELKQKLGDERLVDGMQNGRAQKFEYTIELCWKAIKSLLKEKEGVMRRPLKILSKPTTLEDIRRRMITCCYLRLWKTEIASAICTMPQRVTAFLRAFPAMPRCSNGSARN